MSTRLRSTLLLEAIHSFEQKILVIGFSLLVIISALVGMLNPRGVEAALIVVDRFDDDPGASACTAIDPNDCSLRGAIIKANNFSTNPGLDTIMLPAGTYLLDEVGTGEADAVNGDLDIRGDLIINGADEATTIIDGNGSVTLENVFTIDGSYSAEMNDLTITNGGDGSYVVGGIVAHGGLTMTNVTLDSNQGAGSAGAIYSSTSLSLTDCTVSGNSGQIGGIYVHGGTLDISSSEIFGNTGTGSGGGLNFNNGTGTIDGNTLIHDNDANGGGGISAYGGTLTVSDSQIYLNSANSYGGGVYISTGATVNLNNVIVSTNDSGSGGGGLVVHGMLEMHGGEISSNFTTSQGGAIYAYNSTVDIYDAYVNGNYATSDPSYGGGIYNLGGGLTLDGVTVSLNYVSGTASSFSYGGGIYSSGGDLTLTDTLINENDAIDSGGGVFFSSGTLSVTNSIFRGNEVSGTYAAGGGLFNGSSSLSTIKETEFSANISADISGGLHNQGALALENVTISGNSANGGAGILTTGPDTTDILNSTIYANTVPSGVLAGGIVAYNDVTIKNTIVAGNDNDECLNDSGTAITSLGNNISLDNSCGFSAGSDQPGTDPLLGPLADNFGFSKTHRLLPGSPAIDTGTNTGCPATDQRGWARPVDGDHNGTVICDIGAYEVPLDLFLPLIQR